MADKVCPNCKTVNREGSVFCFNCGTKISVDIEDNENAGVKLNNEVPLSESVAVSSVNSQDVSESKKRCKSFWIKLVSLVTVLVLIVAIVVTTVIIRVSDSSDINDAVFNYVEAVYLGDSDKIENLIPQKYQSTLKKGIKSYGYSSDDLYRNRSALMDSKFGSNIKITYNVSDLERVESFNEFYYLDMLEFGHDIYDVDLEAVYRVKFYVKFVGNESEKTYNYKMAALKIDGEWYLFDVEHKMLAFALAYLPLLDFDSAIDSFD